MSRGNQNCQVKLSGSPARVGDWAGTVDIVSQTLQFDGSFDKPQAAIRRGFRGDTYIFEFKPTLVSPEQVGAVLHYQDPENYRMVQLQRISNSLLLTLGKRVNGQTTTVNGGSFFAWTDGQTVKCIITESGGNQRVDQANRRYSAAGPTFFLQRGGAHNRDVDLFVIGGA